MDEIPPLLNWICQKRAIDCDMDNPYKSTPSVTMTMEHALAYTTQALASHHKGPDIGSLHAMHNIPHLGLGIKAETITPTSFFRESPAAPNFKSAC